MTFKPQILLADDNEYLSELVAARFSSKGWRTVAVTDGGRVMREMQTRDVALLVLDIDMPGESGLQILARLKADPRTATTPVIMLTGRRGKADVEQALKLGALEYIVKPFDLEALVKRIERRLSPPPPPSIEI